MIFRIWWWNVVERAVALLSGGLNSYVAAAFYKKHGAGEIVEAICFNYGQEHCDEIDYASELARILDIPFSTFSPQMSWELTDRITLEQVDHMEQVGLNNSFWFGRDLMIHLLGASRARALKATKVITGAHNSRVDRLALELLGKTIEAALIASELIARRRIRRVLIICPASLQVQWQEEMHDKFALDFTVIDAKEVFRIQRTLGMDANPWLSKTLTAIQRAFGATPIPFCPIMVPIVCVPCP